MTRVSSRDHSIGFEPQPASPATGGGVELAVLRDHAIRWRELAQGSPFGIIDRQMLGDAAVLLGRLEAALRNEGAAEEVYKGSTGCNSTENPGSAGDAVIACKGAEGDGVLVPRELVEALPDEVLFNAIGAACTVNQDLRIAHVISALIIDVSKFRAALKAHGGEE